MSAHAGHRRRPIKGLLIMAVAASGWGKLAAQAPVGSPTFGSCGVTLEGTLGVARSVRNTS